MMNWIYIAIVGFLSGVCASLGIGGGFILLLYLSAVVGMPQKEAQLLNLLFFLPIAILSLILHNKHHLINFKSILPFIIGGIAGVFPGVMLANVLTNEWLSKLFAIFIFIIGIKEILPLKTHLNKREKPPQ